MTTEIFHVIVMHRAAGSTMNLNFKDEARARAVFDEITNLAGTAIIDDDFGSRLQISASDVGPVLFQDMAKMNEYRANKGLIEAHGNARFQTLCRADPILSRGLIGGGQLPQ